MPARFAAELRRRVDEWRSAGKRGLWLKLPAAHAACAGAAVAAGFAFHHAKPEYLELTHWLPASPSPLPRFAPRKRQHGASCPMPLSSSPDFTSTV